MAKVDYNSLSDEVFTGSSSNYQNDVGFFTLKNDNDEAVVRFMYDSVDEFDIQTVHNVKLGERFRKVACIRDPREPIENCPLCSNNTPISQRFFIRLIEYKKVTDSQGNVSIQAEPKVWERAVSYAKTLKSYIDNYGPISDIICKIIRHGKAGSMDTTYEIVPNLSKQIYRDELYKKDPTLFGNFDTLGSIVMNKTVPEIQHFLTTGQFPEVPKQANNEQAAPTTESAYVPQNAPINNTMPPQMPNVAPVDNTYISTPSPAAVPTYNHDGGQTPTQRMPWESSPTAPGFDRPRRY